MATIQQQREERPGPGALMRTFTGGVAQWFSELTDFGDRFATDAARTLGLTSGFGVPVVARGEVLGAIMLVSRRRLFCTEPFLRSLEQLGRSIGEFVSQSEAEARSRMLGAIVESAHDAVLSYTPEGTVTAWVGGAEAMFGHPATEMVGASIERIVPEDRRDELWAINERILAGEVVEPFETTRLHRDGRELMVSVRSTALCDPSGRVIGITSTDRDIGRLKETERRLREADRQKDEFLAMLGHELRNPLASIRSAADLLRHFSERHPELAPTQTVLARQTEHIARLLDGLLDITRMILGKVELESEVVDLAGIGMQVLSDAIDGSGEQGLDITIHAPRPVWVRGDPVRLAQIMNNLLSNAIKYTPAGGMVAMSVLEEGGEAVLRVQDSGVGIPEPQLERVFESFYQVDNSVTREHGGTGLGLAIVKRFVEAHSGEVWVESQPGTGTTFTLLFPLASGEGGAIDMGGLGR